MMGFLLCFAGITIAAGEEVYQNHLPHREALDTEVRFWKNVFAKVAKNQFVIHDVDDLSLVYKTITLDTSLTEREEDNKLKEARKEVEELLLRFHNKQFDVANLTYWENTVYMLFLKNTDPDKFLNASKNIRAQRGIRENFLAGVQRMFTYLPYIEKVFQEYELPRELIYLPHVESSFNPDARSHVGASGMWQFMRSTGRQYMKVNRIKDERFDPLVATRAAAKLLKFNYRLLDDWALAITAYNHGLGSMQKAKRLHGDYLTIRDKYLRRSFGFASKNFYPEVLAVVEICDSLDHYFPNAAKDPVLEFQEIELPKNLNLARFVDQFELDKTEMERLNPGFNRSVWKGQTYIPAKYTLRLPLESSARDILASLGASDEVIGEIKLAQLLPKSNSIAIRQLQEIYARRAKVQKNIRDMQIGVISPDKTDIYTENPETMNWLLALNDPPVEIVEEPVLVSEIDPPAPLEIVEPVSEKLEPTTAKAEPLIAKLDGQPLKYPLDLPRMQVAENPVQQKFPDFMWQISPDEPVSQPVEIAEVEPEKPVEAPPVVAHVETSTPEISWQLVVDGREISIIELQQMLVTRLRPDGDEIIVYPQETVGHFAEWLGNNASTIRRVNGLSRSSNMKTGARLKLDFSTTSPDVFLQKRLNYHMGLIQKYFQNSARVELIQHTIQSGDNLWNLARKKYKFPVNLLLYFNDLNKLEQLFPGDKLMLPVIYQ